MALEEYRRKRDFYRTPEPSGDEPNPIVQPATGGGAAEDRGRRPARGRSRSPAAAAPSHPTTPQWRELPAGQRFCVQMHRATRLHFDFRLEHGGVLLSWAVPRGPSLDPAAKRLTMHVEDHPVDYGDFEGVIPSGYGAGTVMLWDIGTFTWVRESAEDPDRQVARGDVKFELHGAKLSGEFALVQIGARRPGDDPKAWLLLKKRDPAVVASFEARDLDVSVKSGRSLEQIAADGGGDPRERRAPGKGSRSKTAAGAETARPEDPLAAGLVRPARASGERRRRETAVVRGRAVSDPDTPPPGGGRSLSPMLATTVDRPFTRDGWFFEMKYDGVRALLRVDDGRVTVTGRRGRDETARYPEAAAIAGQLRAREALLDAEIVVLDEEGRPSFERLQSRINVHAPADVRRAQRDAPVSVVVFDLLELDGRDLTETALRIRKKTLEDILAPASPVILASHVETEGEALFEALRSRDVEGMIAKRADSPYRPGARSRDWLKVKAWLTQSCVICGFTAGRGARGRLGALILGVNDGGALVHCGQVGSGLGEATLAGLTDRLAAITVPEPPLDPEPAVAEPATWVRPELVCEVRHAGWTRTGQLRHPTFRGLRPELAPADCVRETPLRLESGLEASVDAVPKGQGEGAPRPRTTAVSRLRRSPLALAGRTGPAARGSSGRGAPSPERSVLALGTQTGALARGSSGLSVPDPGSSSEMQQAEWNLPEALERLRHLRATDNWEVAGRTVHLTNLDKVLWPNDGITKRDMVAYYVRMSPLLLPYLRGRPLSMQIFPDGITGKSFWRKDKPGHAPAWIRSWTYHGEKTKEYIVVDEPATLAWVANAGVIDLHPWHSRVDAPEQPDWAVFDLDPFEPATFSDVVDIARLVRAALDHYGMRSVIKTSGQTGLQVYVPLRRGPDYRAVRGWVEEVGRAIGQVEPSRITWEWSVARRTGRIRIDYTQNIINKTLAAPYSLRPADRAPVSAPIGWEELDDPDLRPDRWTLATIGERVADRGDLFADLLSSDQRLPGSP